MFPESESDLVSLRVSVPVEMLAEIRERAKGLGCSEAAVVRTALRDWLVNKEG